MNRCLLVEDDEQRKSEYKDETSKTKKSHKTRKWGGIGYCWLLSLALDSASWTLRIVIIFIGLTASLWIEVH